MKTTNEANGLEGCERCLICHAAPTVSMFTSTITNEELIQLQCENHPAFIAVGSTLVEVMENWKIFLGFLVFTKVIALGKAA